MLSIVKIFHKLKLVEPRDYLLSFLIESFKNSYVFRLYRENIRLKNDLDYDIPESIFRIDRNLSQEETRFFLLLINRFIERNENQKSGVDIDQLLGPVSNSRYLKGHSFLIKANRERLIGNDQKAYSYYLSSMKLNNFFILSSFSRAISLDAANSFYDDIIQIIGRSSLSCSLISFMKARVLFQDGDFKRSFDEVRKVNRATQSLIPNFWLHFQKISFYKTRKFNYMNLFKGCLYSRSIKSLWVNVYLQCIDRGYKVPSFFLFHILKFFSKKRLLRSKYHMLFGRTDETYKAMDESIAIRSLKELYSSQYISSLSEVKGNKLLILPMWGIGDEVIAMAFFKELLKDAESRGIFVTLATIPRLFETYKRTFNNINVICVDRLFNGYQKQKHHDIEITDELYSKKGLLFVLDQKLFDNFPEYEITTLPSLIKEYLIKDENREISFLKASREKLDKFEGEIKYLKKKFGKKKVVGICWRSSRGDSVRSVHYTKLNEWVEGLKENTDTLFINLQCGELDAEERALRDEYLYSIDGLDLFNDLDSQVALFKCLDVVISPCTLTAELAAISGTKVLFTSNSVDVNWRRNGKFDLFYPNTRIVDPDITGDKKSLIRNTLNLLKKYY